MSIKNWEGWKGILRYYSRLFPVGLKKTGNDVNHFRVEKRT
jgi:hypothetical protein